MVILNYPSWDLGGDSLSQWPQGDTSPPGEVKGSPAIGTAPRVLRDTHILPYAGNIYQWPLVLMTADGS